MRWSDPLAIDPREDKLPQWARAKLASARRLVDESQRRAEDARLATDPAGSLVILDRFDDHPIGLGAPPVTFLPSPGADPMDSLTVRPYEGGIEVYASRGPLRFQPSASNVAHVWCAGR